MLKVGIGMMIVHAMHSNFVAPPKPDLISETDYRNFKECINYAYSGRKSLGLSGIYALKMRDGVKIDAFDSSVNEERKKAISRAIEQWNELLTENILGVTNPDSAVRLSIRVIEEFPKNEASEVLGKIKLSRTYGTKGGLPYFKVSAEIMLLNRLAGIKVSESEMQEMVLHELGHLFGLRDHDLNAGIMGPLTLGKPRTELSPSEMDDVRRYRASLNKAIQVIESSKFLAMKKPESDVIVQALATERPLCSSRR